MSGPIKFILEKTKNLYYGWIMVMLAVIGLAVLGIQAYSVGIFMKPITEELQVTRGSLALALTLPGILGGLFQIYAGRLTDRYGPRYQVTACGLVTFIGCYLMSRVQAIWQVYAVYFLPMLIGNAFGYLPIVANLSRWFGPRLRGTAIGIGVTGFTIGGFIGPMMIQSLISSYGWHGRPTRRRLRLCRSPAGNDQRLCLP
jgi:MFS family permease